MLNQLQLKKIETWVKTNARPLEQAKWNYLFTNGSKEKIVAELLKYQNKDGGFGNGLEPDILLPQSNAITSAEAIFTAYEYELDCTEAWFVELLNYFENTIQDNPAFWEPVPKEVEDYPRPPWWGYDAPTKFSPNPSAVIASALIAYGTENQRKIGLSVAQRCIDFLDIAEFYGDHGCYCMMPLVNQLVSIDSQLINNDIISAMKRRIAENVCYDESKWNEYYAQPLDFVHSPSSPWYECVKGGIENNFKFWANNLNSDGVWNPNFSWGVDSDAARQATQNWMGYIAVRRVKTFGNFGML